MALSTAAIRAIAIRRNVARRTAANDNGPKTPRKMSPALLAACVEASGINTVAG